MAKNQVRKACDGGLDPKWLSLKPVNQEANSIGDKMTEAFNVLGHIHTQLRAEGEDLAADRIESAMDYLRDAVDEYCQ